MYSINLPLNHVLVLVLVSILVWSYEPLPRVQDLDIRFRVQDEDIYKMVSSDKLRLEALVSRSQTVIIQIYLMVSYNNIKIVLKGRFLQLREC